MRTITIASIGADQNLSVHLDSYLTHVNAVFEPSLTQIRLRRDVDASAVCTDICTLLHIRQRDRLQQLAAGVEVSDQSADKCTTGMLLSAFNVAPSSRIIFSARMSVRAADECRGELSIYSRRVGAL